MRALFFSFVFLFLFAFSTASAQIGTPCNQFVSGSSPPAGYGAAWNVLSSAKPVFLTSYCNANEDGGGYRQVGTGDPSQYVYRLGYRFKQAWEPFNLTGTFAQGSSDWLVGKGTSNMFDPFEGIPNPYYWVGYVCQWTGSAWKCGCRDASCATNYWNLQAFSFAQGGTTGTGGTTGGTTAGEPPANCSTNWQVVSKDTFGWLPEPVPRGGGVQAKSSSAPRFRRAPAPDGTMAVQHSITTSDIVDTLAYDSPVFRPTPGYCAVMLRYKMYVEAGKERNQPGKYMSLMGGRGQAGGQYQDHYGRQQTGPEGWSFYMTSGASDVSRGVLGIANRSALGAQCSPSTAYEGGDPIRDDRYRCFELPIQHDPPEKVPSGRWVEVEFLSIMNDKNKTNGQAVFNFGGRKVSLSNVMWVMDPIASPELYVRWRMMYGGTPTELPPPNNIKEWYKDFELLVAY